MPLLALMYVRQKDLQIPERIGKAPWKFRTKPELAAEFVEWCVTLFKSWFRKRVMVVADGAYAKRPFLKRLKATGAVVVSRLKKNVAVFDVPEAVKRPGRGRPRKYGRNQISPAHRGGHRHAWMTTWMVLYGKEQTVTFKTSLATYAPADGVIRVVIVKRLFELFSDCSAEWVAFICTDQNVSTEMTIESVADRSAVEPNFHDVKEVHGAGEQLVRNVWCNVACCNLCLWLHTMVELWSWRRSGATLKQRDDRPWDDPTRRPSRADRLKTNKKTHACETFYALPRRHRAARKIQRLFRALAWLVS